MIIKSLIVLNIIWDFLCAFSILFNFYPFSNFHTNLWIKIENRNNISAKHLMAYLILYWGSMRLFGLITNNKNIIIFSYIFEGLIVLSEVLIFNNIFFYNGILLSIFCFFIAFIIFNNL